MLGGARPALTMGAAQSFVNNSAGTLTIGGVVNNGGFLLTVDGSGNTTLNSAISGAQGLTKQGTGTLILGIWPKPFMDYTVAATTIFAHLGGSPVATLLP